MNASYSSNDVFVTAIFPKKKQYQSEMSIISRWSMNGYRKALFDDWNAYKRSKPTDDFYVIMLLMTNR